MHSDGFEEPITADSSYWARNIYEYLQAMRPRLANYIGPSRLIKNLETYLYGYQAALEINRIEERNCAPFSLFLHWLVATRPGSWAKGWANQLLDHARGDNELALNEFFKLTAEFGSLRPEYGESVRIDVGHEIPDLSIAKWLLARLPAQVQLVRLRPAELCYVRVSYFAKQPEDYFLYLDAATAKRLLLKHFGVGSSD